ncbi:MAG: hypothetical protein ACHQ2F_00795 [Desulfobaccales bacterium]
MRYTDKVKDHHDGYSFKNLFLSKEEDCSVYFGDIHILHSDLFKELYVIRNAVELLNTELLTEIESTNITTWDESISKISKGSGLEDNIKYSEKQHEGFFVQLVSPVASGKTTYLHYFLKFILPNNIPNRVIYLPIVFDVRELSINNETIHKNIFEHINNSLDAKYDFFAPPSDRENYIRKTHTIEMKLFYDEAIRRGVPTQITNKEDIFQSQRRFLYDLFEQDYAKFIRKKIQYIRSQCKTYIIFVLDNIDQHALIHIGNIRYTLSQLSKFSEIDTIISLRDTTFRLNYSYESGASFPRPRTYVLSPANADYLGKNRLEYFHKVISAKHGRNNFIKFLSTFIDQDAKYISQKASEVERSSYDYGYIWDWLENISNKNFREMLSMLQRALESHHLTSIEFTKERVDSFDIFEMNTTNINIKRLKTAFINGASKYYNESFSDTDIMNLFDHFTYENKLHYTHRLKLLQLINSMNFFKLSKFYEKIIHSGFFSKNEIDKAIICFLQKQLIYSEIINPLCGYERFDMEGVIVDKLMDSVCYITPNGRFHINILIYDDIYLDEMKYATDHSKENYDKIFKNLSQKFPVGRKISTCRFVKLIQEEEEKTETFYKNYSLPMLAKKMHNSYYERKKKESEYWPQQYSRYINQYSKYINK